MVWGGAGSSWASVVAASEATEATRAMGASRAMGAPGTKAAGFSGSSSSLLAVMRAPELAAKASANRISGWLLALWATTLSFFSNFFPQMPQEN